MNDLYPVGTLVEMLNLTDCNEWYPNGVRGIITGHCVYSQLIFESRPPVVGYIVQLEQGEYIKDKKMWLSMICVNHESVIKVD